MKSLTSLVLGIVPAIIALRVRARVVATTALVLIFVAMSLPASAQELSRLPEPQPVGSLSPGDTLFWDGELFVDRVLGANFIYGGISNGGPLEEAGLAQEACNIDPCWAYEIDVAEGADRLRVWLDSNRRSDCVWFELWSPGTYGDPDARRTAVSQTTCNDFFPGIFPMLWTLEENIPNPEPGKWVVRVLPMKAEGWGFRMRASLDSEPKDRSSALLPDLTGLPPYDIGFEGSVNPAGGSTSDNTNLRSSAVSCTPAEIAEASREGDEVPARCLRFSAGVYNMGQGPMDLRLYKEDELPRDVPLRDGGDVIQRIWSGDGAVEDQQAGTWRSGGLHDYLVGFQEFELYRVVAHPSHPAPNEEEYLELAGDGHNLGWAYADQRLYDWYRFDPWVPLATFLRCRDGDVSQDPGIVHCTALSPGWGDHFRWNRPGMYVDFPLNIDGAADGDYVVRMIIDRYGNIEESDENNNVSYAWVRVAGDRVTVCERGQGFSPWDPRKRVHEPSFWVNTPGGTTADQASEDCA